MSSILKRTAVLSVSRFLNRVITFVTPLFLVRILDVDEFGQYREFLLYAMLLAAIAGFSANRSLTYFLPKYPRREQTFLTQSVVMIGAITIAVLVLLFFARDLVLQITSFDFVTPLALFCIFYANLDFVEMYYVAKKRSEIVLYYGVARLLVRVTIVVIVAYMTGDVVAVIYAVAFAEAVRFFAVLFVSLHRKLLNLRSITRESLDEQSRFVVPIGISGVLLQLGERSTNIFVSLTLGPTALALYTIGIYQRPIVSVLRGALADAIFPDMVQRGKSRDNKQLPLWQRSTVAYCMFLFPLAAVLFINAGVVIELLFTEKFLDAVPVFQVFCLLLVLYCFEFDLPMRALGITKYFLRASWIALTLKVALISIGYVLFGFLGPALGAVLAQFGVLSYLASRCIRVSGVRLSELLDWGQIGKIAALSLLCAAIFPLVGYIIPNDLLSAVVGCIAYSLAYLVTTLYFGVGEMRSFSRRIEVIVQRKMGKTNPNDNR